MADSRISVVEPSTSRDNEAGEEDIQSKDVFDIPIKERDPRVRLARWRRATYVLNAARRHRYFETLREHESGARLNVLDLTRQLLEPIRLAADDTSLHIAVFREDDEDVLHVLQREISSDVDRRNSKGRTPLHYASRKGNIKIVRLLLERGSQKDARDSYGATPFHFAACLGDTTLLEMLQVGDINNPAGRSGLTALHFAAWHGKNPSVEWLLDHGASTHVVDAAEGDTPLHSAARRGNENVVERLILCGDVDVHQSNKKGQWAIALADEHGHYHTARAFVRALTMAKVGTGRTITDSYWVNEQQGSNGATMLHYFAAYGTEQDLEWFLTLIVRKIDSIHSPKDLDMKDKEFQSTLNMKDAKGRYAVHWAAMKGNMDTVKIFAKNHLVDMNADNELFLYETPLSLAVLSGHLDFAEELLKWEPENEDWLGNAKIWMKTYYNQKRKMQTSFDKEFLSLQDGFKMHTRLPDMFTQDDIQTTFFLEMPLMYLALCVERDDITNFMKKHRKGVKDSVNEKGDMSGRTALHWATLLRQTKLVTKLCSRDDVVANVEDMFGKTALQYAKEMGFSDVENKLMQRKEVSVHVDGMYKDRQLYVDATNAILVGAALIASVTFAGWLQPPLSYTSYYNLPHLLPPSPPDVFQSYAAIQQHMGVRVFWIFNSLSFSFAIATVLAGLVAVVPIRGMYIASSLKHLHRCLVLASGLLGVSIVFVLGAFAAAGFAVLPPIFKYQANMMATIIVGGMPCLAMLVWFAYRLCAFRLEWLIAILKKSYKSKPAPARNVEAENDNIQPPDEAQPGSSSSDVDPFYSTMIK